MLMMIEGMMIILMMVMGKSLYIIIIPWREDLKIENRVIRMCVYIRLGVQVGSLWQLVICMVGP